MLKKVVVTNYLGESIECKIEGVEAENDSGLIITSIDGLGPVKATINMTEIPSSDGSIYNSSRLTNRNIVIKAIFTHASSIEEARHLSYRYFPINRKLTLTIETDSRTGTVEGYVESNEPDIFSKQSSFQISILCESSYFTEGENNEYPLPAAIEYTGDINSGMEIDFDLTSENITDSFRVSDIELTKSNGDGLSLDFTKMSGIVPNTMPNNTPEEECVYIYDLRTDQYKCIGVFPEKVYSLSPYYNYSHCVSLNGEIHVITRTKIYKNVNGEWILVSNVPPNFDGYGSVAVYRNEIHILRGDYHYKWSYQRGWEFIGAPPRYVKNSNLCVFDGSGGLHLFGAGLSSNTSKEHYVFIKGSWRRLSDMPVGIEDGTILRPNDGNIIHIFCEATDSKGSYHMAYSWVHDEWIFSTRINDHPVSGRIVSLSDTATVIFRNSEFHIFSPFFGNATDPDYNKAHLILTGEADITRVADSPKSFYAGAGCLCTDPALLTGDVVYFIGGSGGNVGGTITEPPNNICLVENDHLTINTKKGQKSVSLTRGNSTYNILNTFKKGSKWLELNKGINEFEYQATGDSEQLEGTIKAPNALYEGM